MFLAVVRLNNSSYGAERADAGKYVQSIAFCAVVKLKIVTEITFVAL